MRKRDSSGPGKGGRRKSSDRGEARSNSPRGNRSSSSSNRKEKPFGNPREDRDESKRDFSKSPRGKSFGRSKDDSSKFSSRSEKPYGRPRKEGDESKPRSSKYSGDRDDSKRDFSKSPRGKSFGRSKDDSSKFSSRSEKPYGRPRKEGDESKPRSSKYSGDRDDSKRDFSKSSRGKSFGRSKDDSKFSSRSERPYSRPRRDEDESKPRTSRFTGARDEEKKGFSKSPRGKSFEGSRDEKPRGEEKSFDSNKSGDKKSFFSKLSRGGKSFEKRRHDSDFGKSVKDYSDHKEEQKDSSPDKVRLNKYISNSGVCSRREADELITMGLVSVNGTVITELGYKVNRTDVIKYDGKTLRSEKPVYILMNKPKGFLTTTKDPLDRNTVMAIIAGAVKERVYPVGRLDRNTTGLLLLTNDGDLTEKLSHPSYNVKKIYKVELDKPLTKTDFQKISEGIVLEEGRAMVDDLAIVSEDGKTVGIELHIGWNRVVRRIFERLEYTVVKLDRTIYAGLDKKDLARGHWRFLTKEEVVRLKHYNK